MMKQSGILLAGKSLKIIFIPVLVTSFLYADSFFSDSKKGVAPVKNELYKTECGSCHFAYQPGLLPQKSWTKLMNNLENHFDTDASLEKEDLVSINNYLKNNSAEKFMQYKRSKKIVRSIRQNSTPIAISQTPYMKRKHDEIKPSLITQKEVRGIFNCTACHTTAEKGSYSERDILIPNFGRWDD